jgi:predicted nuclease of restriction endonuclease-like RecB superfamily
VAVRRGTPTVVEGVTYRSGFEAAVASALVEAGALFEHENDHLFYEVPRMYVPDFTITTSSGKTLYIEAKGYFPAEDRQKMAEVKRANPALDLRIVFQRPHTKLSKARGAWTYATWADRHSILWAEGSVPDEWLGE